MLKLLKPIYALAGSDDQWHRTLDDHLQIDLEMTPTIFYSSLYFKFQYNKLFGLNERYVDDLLHAGTDEWQTEADGSLGRLKTTGNE